MEINKITTPQNAFMVNQYTKTNDTTNCNSFNSPNNFGNYFDRCTKESESAYWGSNKPVKDNCLTPQMGKPCHNIWNNVTKRKTIVDYDRGQVVKDLYHIPRQNVMPSNRGPSEPAPTPVRDVQIKQDIKLPKPICNCDCNCR